MLIVEGPDGSGKTTLIGRLERRLSLTREPRAVSHEAKALTDMAIWTHQELDRGFGNRLYDRFNLISSPFYSMLPAPTFSGQMLDEEWLRTAWQKFRQVGPMIIICLPPKDTVIQNVWADPSNQVVQKDIGTIWNLYHNFAAQYPFGSMVWDYTKKEEGAEAELDMVIQNFKGRCAHVKLMQRLAQAEEKRKGK